MPDRDRGDDPGRMHTYHADDVTLARLLRLEQDLPAARRALRQIVDRYEQGVRSTQEWRLIAEEMMEIALGAYEANGGEGGRDDAR